MNISARRVAFFSLIIATVVGFSGCGKTSSQKSDPESKKAESTKLKLDHKPADKWEGKVTIEVGGVKEYQALVEKHKGKVVVVDLWSTWCKPCLEELPKMAAVQQIYGDKVVCIAVALDYEANMPNDPKHLEEIRKPVEESFRKAFGKMLGKDGELNAEFRLFIANDVGEKFMNALNAVSQPTILVYDQSGKMTLFDINTVNQEKNEKAKKAGEKRPTQDEVSYNKHIVPVLDKLTK